MAKFNTPTTAVGHVARATSPIKTKANESPTIETYNGAPGFERKSKGELFLLSVTNMVGEDTFYEGSSDRDKRFRELVRKIAEKDPAWMARFIPWLRNEANMRTASIVAAVEFAQAHKGVTDGVTVRSVVASALVRADEPGEAIAYAKSQGYKLAGGFQRGLADAATRLFTERNVLKWDGDSHDWRFGDVLEVTHASPRDDAEWQGDLFQYVISRRHKRADLAIPDSLSMLRKNAMLAALPVAERKQLITEKPASIADLLGEAGMTWESLSGWLQGPMDAEAWEAIIPSMGYMALLRNLRNFDQAGVSDGVAGVIAAKLADPEQVAKSRQLPMRFLSAYNAAPSLRWAWALEQALSASLQNVPQLGGRTLILVDTSSSMQDGFSRDGSLKRWDAAAMFGIALASRAEHADIVSYGGSTIRAFPYKNATSLLKALDDFKRNYFFGGGTPTVAALQQNFADHDRVIILTDEQADSYSHGIGSYGARSSVTVNDAIPASVPLYNWNLAGYRAASTPSGKENRHAFGGLSDQSFKIMSLLESGRDGTWPF